MQELYKVETPSGIQVHTSSGIQLSVKKRKDKDSYYVYHNRKQVCLSDMPELSTETYPVYWDYVFGGGWERYSNFWYDKLLNKKH
ncbi:MAG TPA: hypothetical protein VFT06_00385 [Flavisolibacter sp.]|nr:hypothetical protein [Flavisolibacter sp.]